MDILPQREHRFKDVIASRQYDLTVVLENVHDPHNIGAVLRTCDSVGISEIYIIYTEPNLIARGIEVGYKSSSGSTKWIDIHYYTDLKKGMDQVKEKYTSIYGTKIQEDSGSLYDLDLTESVALLFGNEHSGISDEAAGYINSNFLIPQHGFVRSLNISVACAVTLYEAQRQRLADGRYGRPFGTDKRDHLLYEKYLEQHHLTKYESSLLRNPRSL
ncbi:MAG: RNA methyltransferase [Bacteroidota bacterium]